MHCDVDNCDRSDRKIEKQSFLWCCYNYAEGRDTCLLRKEKGHSEWCNKDS